MNRHFRSGSDSAVNLYLYILARDATEVPYLSTHLAVERCPVKYYVDFVSCIDRVRVSAVLPKSDDQRLAAKSAVAFKHGRRHIREDLG